MSAAVWLLIAVAAAIGGIAVGWPAWRDYRRRDARDSNVDRYMAWRGRAVRPSSRPSEGMTRDERRRIYIGLALGVVAAFCIVGFFTYA